LGGQFGFLFEKIDEHLNSRSELEARLSPGTFVSDGIHDDATDTTTVEGDEGAVDFGGLERDLGMGASHAELRHKTQEFCAMCDKLTVRVKAASGDQIALSALQGELLSLFRAAAADLDINHTRLRNEIEDRRKTRDKKQETKSKQLQKSEDELRRKAQQRDTSVQVSKRLHLLT